MMLGLRSKLFVFLLLLPLTFGCSCPFSYSRSQTICNVYSSDSPVYKARVTSAYCKCLPSTGTTFSCIQFYPGQNNDIMGTVEGLFQCAPGSPTFGIQYHYSLCNSTITRAGTTYSNVMNMTDQMAENVTCFGHYTNGTGCTPTAQPCYYTIMIEAVYKGNSIQVGQYLNTSGPDVLTSCGHSGYILTVNESYVVGVGGTCSYFNDWSLFSSFTSKEINVLEMAGQSNTVCFTDEHLSVIIGVTVPLAVIIIIIVVSILVTVTLYSVWKRKQNLKTQSSPPSKPTPVDETITQSSDHETKVEDDDKSGLI